VLWLRKNLRLPEFVGGTERGWPGMERSEAPDGHETRIVHTQDAADNVKRRAPGLPVGPTLFASVPAPATRRTT